MPKTGWGELGYKILAEIKPITYPTSTMCLTTIV
jgi:hypothetical protein